MSQLGRKKILFITPWYPREESPYDGDFIREHAKAVRLYDDVAVLHIVGSDRHLPSLWKMERQGDNELVQDIPTYRFWYRSLRIPKMSYMTYLAGIMLAFGQLARSFNPDVIHAHIHSAAFPAVCLGKLSGTPVVITEHASAYQRQLLNWQELSLVRIAFSSASCVTPVSGSLQKTIEHNGIRARWFQVVPNVVDTSLFYPSSIAHNGSVARLLTACFFDPSGNKGLDTLLRALALLAKRRTDWNLDLIGDGPARRSYEVLAQELEIADHVTFRGLQTRAQVGECMRKSSLVIVPSVFETFSIVAAEALASGVPVLATRCGGPEDFITDEVGMLVAPSDPQAMCEGVAQMLANIGAFSSERISSYARNRFSHEQVGQTFHGIYARVGA